MSTYGYFDDQHREYVITRPDTPLPWLNMLGQDDFFGICTQTAGGYSFWKDARLRRLTRYRYNSNPMDNDGRFLYVKQGGTVWNPGWKPTRTALDAYECRHGLGYTRITGCKRGVEVEQLVFVPPNENLEVWRVAVRNRSRKPQRLTLFSFVEFCFYEALNDMTNYQRTYSIGEVEVEGSAIYHKTEYRERRNHYAMFGCTRPVDGYDTSRDQFVGVHHGLHDPQAVLAGRCRNSRAYGWNPVGAHQVNLTLKPGAEEIFAFVLAYVEQGDLPKFAAPYVLNKTKGREILARFSDVGAIDAAFAAVKARWDELLSVYQAPQVPNAHLRRMVNTWNQCQVMATFNLSRSTSGYETGIGRGMGFRDSNQDLLGFVHMLPARARQRLLDIAATQLSDGTCYHQYQPLTKKGNAEAGSGFNDDPLWLILATCAYLRETGDATILDEPIGYADQPGSRSTLLEHLETSLRYTQNHRGPHGLPLIGRADWNDCLNLNCFSREPNESFQTTANVGRGDVAESVMIAGLFLCAARDLAALYRWRQRGAEASRVDAAYADMLQVIETQAWDGEWYTRAFDAESRPIGSKACAEGRIFIESQAWCVLGGAGRANGRARRALEAVDRHLYRRGLGCALQFPPYSEYHLELGEVSSYPPGYKENAGVFSHNNTWIHIAWTLFGEGEKALDYYLSICPSAKPDHDIYRSEPYVYAQMTASHLSPTPGEAKNSWLTGTAAWSFVVASQYILGIQPDFDGLRIDPCIPKKWKGFTVRRRFRGVLYTVTVRNPKGVSKGVRSLLVDGRKIAGNLLPLPADGRTAVNVEVTLGA
ncbi:MAG TPA: glycosyl hydrolase family 65 protein [Opitutaceae bacterium]|nr:glycosyl hydrolase family 65 protein [Opitutaceae bacterium]